MKLREIERLRAYAVIITIMGHIPALAPILPSALTRMIGGVHLFFVISGYVISTSFLRTLRQLHGHKRPGAALKVFYLKRFFRIMPLAATWCLIPLLSCVFFKDPAGSALMMLREMAAIFTFSYNYAIAYGLSLRFQPYWSLSVEEQFYFIFPLAMILLPTFRGRMAFALVGMALIALVLRPLIPFHGPTECLHIFNWYTSHRTFDCLLAGVALGLLRGERWGASLKNVSKTCLQILAFLSLAAITMLPGLLPESVGSNGGVVAQWFFSVILVGLASLDRGFVLEIPGLRRILEYLGSRSYAMYLTNTFAIVLLNYVFKNQQKLFLIPTTFATTLVLSELSHRLIEQPFIRWGHRLVGKGFPFNPATHPSI